MYMAAYKCRLCGEVYHKGLPVDESRALVTATMIAAGVQTHATQAPTPQAVHACRHVNGFGLADLLGWRKEEDVWKGPDAKGSWNG